ncbi:MAG: glycine/betaine ABC transporter substrate-binding protein [Candidatus Methanofastidiosum sp.]|nr:glycine/betaine ABC transporter substrate-binding protein [Methanofastidiosum sp.]
MSKNLISFFVILTLIVAMSGCIGQGTEQKTIVVGAKTFNEQYILAEMVSLILQDKGYKTEVRSGMNDATLFEGIKKGQIDVYVEYTGTAYAQLLKYPALEVWDPEVVYDKVKEGLEKEKIVVLNMIGFRDDYAIAIKEDFAIKNNIETIEDLMPYATNMRFGSDLVFHEREDGLPRLKLIYGIQFKEVRPMSPTLMYEAIKNNEVDAIPPYTTDTRVDLYNLKILQDNKSALPPYNAILLISEKLNQDAKVIQALSVLDNLIDTDTMRALNYKFDVEKQDAKAIAKEFLVQKGIIKG